MIYVFVSYNYSPSFNTPQSWFKRTEGYAGVLECLSERNTVFNVKQINYKGNQTYKGVEYRFVDFGKKKTYFPHQLNQYVKSLNPDIVVVQGLHHPLQLIQLRYVLNRKTKIIAQHHAEKPFTGIRKYIQRIADRYIDAYLFASHAMGMDWVNKGNLASSKKIHEVMEVSSLFHPVDKVFAISKTDVSGSPVFLWVGRLNENKDPLNVVTAFLEFNNTYPASSLYMIYHTDELLNEIKLLINKHENEDAIMLIGKVPHDDLLYWFNSADFIISCSHYEGSGTAVCEAMSCGCVPIVTDIFSFQMITDNGNCGLLYEAGNQAALLSALYKSLTLDMKTKKSRSLEYFKSKLSFGTIAKQIEEIALSL
ncbi:MAG TPA: glycosyltransferase family 4 protein [Mucilaginibacter sp.]|jgi:glycosyltransferase involved in cell wall biosynthesis